MYQGRIFQRYGPGEVNTLNNIGCYRGNNVQSEEAREATSCRRAVSLRWFPEQPNLEDEIYSKGGRFVTPRFSQLFSFPQFFSFLVAVLVLEHLVGLELV